MNPDTPVSKIIMETFQRIQTRAVHLIGDLLVASQYMRVADKKVEDTIYKGLECQDKEGWLPTASGQG